MHDELAQQAGLPSNGCEFRACGDTRTLNPNRPASARSADRRVRQASPALDMASGGAVRESHRRDPTRRARIRPRRTTARDRNSARASPRRHRNGFAAPGRTAADGAPCRANATWSHPPSADRCCGKGRVHPAGCRHPDGGRALGIRRHLIRRFGHPDRCALESLQGNAAVDLRAGLDHGHPRAGPGQAISDQRAGNAGAHDQHIALLGQKTLFRYWKGPRPSFQDRRGTGRARDPLRQPATSRWCRNCVCRTIRPA
jgi:hypothetical protein